MKLTNKELNELITYKKTLREKNYEEKTIDLLLKMYVTTILINKQTTSLNKEITKIKERKRKDE